MAPVPYCKEFSGEQNFYDQTLRKPDCKPDTLWLDDGLTEA